MNTDRELLELAAKAAGIVLSFKPHDHNRGAGAMTAAGIWSPLTDDGDALRLAVKLNIVCHQFDGDEQLPAFTNAGALINDETLVDMYENHEEDKYAATRRAIVRAAAEIGKAMP